MDNLGQLVCTKTEMCGSKSDSFAGESSERRIGMYGTRRDGICDDDDDVADNVATVVSAEDPEGGDTESWCAMARR